MSGLTIFMLGAVALSNIGLLLFLMRDQKGQPREQKPPDDNTGESKLPEPEPIAQAPDSCIGKSQFNAEEFQAKFDLIFKKVEEIEKQTFKLRDKMIGDVDESDVEFGETEDKSTDVPEQVKTSPVNAETEAQPKDARMNKTEEAQAFEDVRINDVEPDTVSAPSATGLSIDEIEDSVNTFEDVKATPEQRGKAARLLARLEGTNLMDLLSQRSPKITADIRKCVLEDVRERMTGNKFASSVSRSKRKGVISDNLDDFDPEDWLPK